MLSNFKLYRKLNQSLLIYNLRKWISHKIRGRKIVAFLAVFYYFIARYIKKKVILDKIFILDENRFLKKFQKEEIIALAITVFRKSFSIGAELASIEDPDRSTISSETSPGNNINDWLLV